MKNLFRISKIILFASIVLQCNPSERFSRYPQTVIANDQATMRLFLPDPQNGFYRATRFDWSGIIASLKFKEHEYFGYWKDTHDPKFHEDISGPVESYQTPGLGFEDSTFDGRFIRIGVGVLSCESNNSYQWNKTYEIIDNGEWEIKNGDDWIQFRHTLKSDFGYGYVYIKKIDLKTNEPGFTITHILKNIGEKKIETDQYNHNFFIIDQENAGPNISVEFPFNISTENDLKNMMIIDGKKLSFIKNLSSEEDIWLPLEGFSNNIQDHEVVVKNEKTGAGAIFKVNKPLSQMAFWACKTTYSPENFINIVVEPGETEKWVSDYTLFSE